MKPTIIKQSHRNHLEIEPTDIYRDERMQHLNCTQQPQFSCHSPVGGRRPIDGAEVSAALENCNRIRIPLHFFENHIV